MASAEGAHIIWWRNKDRSWAHASECKVTQQYRVLSLGGGAAAGVKGWPTAGQHADQGEDTERDGGGDELAFHLPPLERALELSGRLGKLEGVLVQVLRLIYE